MAINLWQESRNHQILLASKSKLNYFTDLVTSLLENQTRKIHTRSWKKITPNVSKKSVVLLWQHYFWWYYKEKYGICWMQQRHVMVLLLHVATFLWIIDFREHVSWLCYSCDTGPGMCELSLLMSPGSWKASSIWTRSRWSSSDQFIASCILHSVSAELMGTLSLTFRPRSVSKAGC